MTNPTMKKKAFTLIETVFATILVGILISATFAVLRYSGQTTQESRDAIRIAQQLENNMTILRALARQNGWETFLQTYFATPQTYTLTATSPFIAASVGGITEGQWRVTLSADPDLGPYLSRVSLAGTTYTLTFSSPVYGKVRDPNQLIPIVSSTVTKWTDDNAQFPTVPSNANLNVNVTSSAGQVAALTGQRLKPTGNVVDREERADITSQNGVVLPANGASSNGYPSVVKVRLETMSGGTTLSYITNLSAEP